LKKEQEDKYRLEQLKLNGDVEEEEEEPITEEYLVYICLCCHKKFLTANSFQNHIKSKKHRANAALYEEAGIICTEIHLLEDFDDDEYSYEGGGGGCNDGVYEFVDESENSIEDESEEEEEEESEDDEDDDEPRKGGAGLFSVFGALSDSDSSSSESSDDEEDEEETKSQDYDFPIQDDEDLDEENKESEDEYNDDLDLLEEIIFQNRLQERFYPDDETNEADDKAKEILPVEFNEAQYNLNKDQSRLAAIQYRLQKR